MPLRFLSYTVQKVIEREVGDLLLQNSIKSAQDVSYYKNNLE